MSDNELRVIAKEVIMNHERLAVSSAQRYALKLAVEWIAEHPEHEAKCEHRIDDGDWCEPCNLEYKRAALEAVV